MLCFDFPLTDLDPFDRFNQRNIVGEMGETLQVSFMLDILTILALVNIASAVFDYVRIGPNAIFLIV